MEEVLKIAKIQLLEIKFTLFIFFLVKEKIENLMLSKT